MDLDALLSAREEDNPSGEDLEYDLDFTEMELAALPGEEKQAGDEFIPGEEPDYKEVSTKALAILERSHDLRAGIFLANSDLRVRGFEGFADATAYLRGLLETYWATCHPELDADDDNDPTMRVNSVLALADNDKVIRSLKLAPITESRTFGRLSMRDISVASGEIAAPADMENVPDMQAVSAAFQDTDAELLTSRFDAVKAAVENVNAINAVFDEQTPGMGPNLEPLTKLLKQISSQMAEHVTGAEAAEEVSDEADGATATSAAPAGGGPMGAINSPNDVQNALDRIIAYYARSEPSSPVPILLERAKRLVGADFLAIVKDMAPHGVENVNLIGGIVEDDGY